jgi:hypothetical protein
VSDALPPRAVLDSDVIFSRVLYELFGRAAATAGLLTLLWSDELLAEAKRALIECKALTAAIAGRWVGYLSQSFPEGRVEIAAQPAGVELSGMTTDPGDEHVCAARSRRPRRPSDHVRSRLPERAATCPRRACPRARRVPDGRLRRAPEDASANPRRADLELGWRTAAPGAARRAGTCPRRTLRVPGPSLPQIDTNTRLGSNLGSNLRATQRNSAAREPITAGLIN